MMKLAAMVVAGVLVAGVAVSGEHPDARQAEKEDVPEAKVTLQTTCPVMGGKINKDLYVDHDGKRVYVCCKGCIDAVTKNPEKYIKKLEADGDTVAKVQTTCPVTGENINKDLYVDHDGKRVYVCCKECIAAVEKDPEKYIKKLEADGVALDPAAKGEAMKEGAHGGHEGHHH